MPKIIVKSFEWLKIAVYHSLLPTILTRRKRLQLLIKKNLQDTAATQLENTGFYYQIRLTDICFSALLRLQRRIRLSKPGFSEISKK